LNNLKGGNAYFLLDYPRIREMTLAKKPGERMYLHRQGRVTPLQPDEVRFNEEKGMVHIGDETHKRLENRLPGAYQYSDPRMVRNPRRILNEAGDMLVIERDGHSIGYRLTPLKGVEEVVDADTIPDEWEQRTLAFLSRNLNPNTAFMAEMGGIGLRPPDNIRLDVLSDSLMNSTWQGINQQLARLDQPSIKFMTALIGLCRWGIRGQLEDVDEGVVRLIRENVDERSLNRLFRVIKSKYLWSKRKNLEDFPPGRVMSDAKVESQLERLQSNDAEVRKDAAENLAEHYTTLTEITEPERENAINSLLPSLGDGEDYVRGSVAATLGVLESQKAVEPLMRLLRDKSSFVRKNAAFALGAIGNRMAAQELIEALDDPEPEVRENVVFSLWRLEDERALKPMMERLKTEDDEVVAMYLGLAIRYVLKKPKNGVDE